jgi:hypothetical protein
MAKHALPRTLLSMHTKDRARTGRGRSKADADLTLLEACEQLQADEFKRTGKRRSRSDTLRPILRLNSIIEYVDSGLQWAVAERLVNAPDKAERKRFATALHTMNTRLSRAKKRRQEQQMLKQAALSRVLRSRT